MQWLRPRAVVHRQQQQCGIANKKAWAHYPFDPGEAGAFRAAQRSVVRGEIDRGNRQQRPRSAQPQRRNRSASTSTAHGFQKDTEARAAANSAVPGISIRRYRRPIERCVSLLNAGTANRDSDDGRPALPADFQPSASTGNSLVQAGLNCLPLSFYFIPTGGSFFLRVAFTHVNGLCQSEYPRHITLAPATATACSIGPYAHTPVLPHCLAEREEQDAMLRQVFCTADSPSA